MSRPTAVLLLACVGTVGLLGVGAARAAAPDVTVTSPGTGSSVATATPTVAGSVAASAPTGRITGSLELTASSAAGHPGWSLALSDWCGRASCSFSVPVSPGLQWNGTYDLAVQAQETDATGRTEPVTYETSFSVAAPPASPGDVTATPSADGSSVALSWSEPSYPDLVGYQVTRSPAGAGFPTSVSSPGFVDRSVTPGVEYGYRITAVRQGATDGTTLASGPASASAAIPPPSGDASPGSGGPTSPAAVTGPAGTGPSVRAGGAAGTAAASRGAGGGRVGATPGVTASGSGLPARAAPASPALPSTGAADGVAPGSDNPAVAPFSGAEADGPLAGAVTITTSASAASARDVLVRDYGALALAALVVAVMAHLLWLRRRLRPAA